MFFKIKKKQLTWGKTIKSVPHNYSMFTFDIEPKGFLAVFVRPSGIIPILREWTMFKSDRELKDLSTSVAYTFPYDFASQNF